MGYQAVVIGASTGSFQALKIILPYLSSDFSLPVIIVVHRHRHSNTNFEHQLSQFSSIQVLQAEPQLPISGPSIFVAPPNYHLLIEEGRTFSLSLEKPVHFARPSIDITFETAAQVYGSGLIGVILTGANEDGSYGLTEIKKKGGVTIVQSPESAAVSEMPTAAINRSAPHKVLAVEEIGPFLNTLDS